ncbi:alpha/beta hydrolase [Saccharomonospora piscinae]|uniref:BD-FAE-like domain-containing protein n=1 Tax=Saccharomonospora piscinae TaxID=687388 RepID=W5VFC8_SACPI|nr:alpha/beta hydrolase [Saccharomonospora piscinae]AHH53514.1 hypothetical protein [Saccharomonospora piscinae]
MAAAVFRSYDQHELDIQYSPSSRVDDVQSYLREYARLSARARTEIDGFVEIRYGEFPEQVVDYFPAGTSGGSLLVFVHGGYWQELSRRESAFMAADLIERGVSVAALGYGLAPRYTVPEIVTMVSEGVRWLCRNAAGLPGSPRRVVLSGSSAGAHLTTMSLLDEAGWRRDGWRPAEAVSGAVLLSGVYDLDPVRRTYVNAPLGLDADTALACSPQRRPLAGLPPLVVARGDNETGEFARQQREFVAAVRRAGGSVNDLVVRGRNHFDLAFDLGDPATSLGAAVARLVE